MRDRQFANMLSLADTLNLDQRHMILRTLEDGLVPPQFRTLRLAQCGTLRSALTPHEFATAVLELVKHSMQYGTKAKHPKTVADVFVYTPEEVEAYAHNQTRDVCDVSDAMKMTLADPAIQVRRGARGIDVSTSPRSNYVLSEAFDALVQGARYCGACASFRPKPARMSTVAESGAQFAVDQIGDAEQAPTVQAAPWVDIVPGPSKTEQFDIRAHIENLRSMRTSSRALNANRAPTIAGPLAAAWRRADNSVFVRANDILEPSSLALVQGYLPKKPFFKTWSHWIQSTLPADAEILTSLSSRIFLTPEGPPQHKTHVWDLSGNFISEVGRGCFPEFTHGARFGIMVMFISESLFRRLSLHLDPPKT